eukprot:gene1031-814_t
MAAVPVDQLSPEQRDELLCVYSALILHDDEAEISAANMNKIIAASGAKVEPYWPGLFERILKDADVGELLLSTGGGGGAAAPAAGGDAAAPAAGGEAKKEEKVEEEEEEEDMDFDLFG